MMLFLLGLILGLGISGIASYLYWRGRYGSLRGEHALLHGRLRSLLCLVEIGALKPENRDAISLLSETRAMVTDGHVGPVHTHRPVSVSEEHESTSWEPDFVEDDVAPIFPR